MSIPWIVLEVQEKLFTRNEHELGVLPMEEQGNTFAEYRPRKTKIHAQCQRQRWIAVPGSGWFRYTGSKDAGRAVINKRPYLWINVVA